MQAGVLEKIIDKAAASPRYDRMLRTGCRWLDAKAREQGSPGFNELSAEARDALLVQAASGTRKSPARRFFTRIRIDAFSYYYAEPITWKPLNYPGPPQPNGFRDYVLPPKRMRP